MVMREILAMTVVFPRIRWRHPAVVVREVQAVIQTDRCPELAELAILAIFPVCRFITQEAEQVFVPKSKSMEAWAAADHA